jgi:hypothetical protein
LRLSLLHFRDCERPATVVAPDLDDAVLPFVTVPVTIFRRRWFCLAVLGAAATPCLANAIAIAVRTFAFFVKGLLKCGPHFYFDFLLNLLNLDLLPHFRKQLLASCLPLAAAALSLSSLNPHRSSVSLSLPIGLLAATVCWESEQVVFPPI